MVNKLIQCPKNKLLRLYIIQGKTKLVKQIVNQYIPDINYDINEFMVAYSDRCDEMFGHSPAPKCPTCGSTNIKKLGAFYSTGFTPKYFECNNCGYMW